MFRSTYRHAFVVLAFAACLSLVGSAHAATVPHKESSNGQIFNVTATQFEWASEGQGTHFGRYTEAGVTRYYDDGSVDGEFTVTAADGSTISGIFYGTFEDQGNGYTSFEVTVYWLVGTGRLEGVLGIGSASATVENATGLAHIDASGTWELP